MKPVGEGSWIPAKNADMDRFFVTIRELHVPVVDQSAKNVSK